ncbi:MULTISPECIES: phosphotransferase [unclassified Mycobacteroides]|uniref:phosphotransferase n=1 Tax=unclassified Mycobacteroides TaxID=2618759 RepID=UPI001396A3CF|nr:MULTISPECIES: phosphotransferase [unclassified Mycobacteroides]
MFEAVRAAGSLVDQTARYVVDRTLPARSMPKAARDVRPEWVATALGLRPADVERVTVADEHHGTASRALLSIEYREPGMGPATVFLKFAPTAFVGRLFMNALGLGEREVDVYRTIPGELPGIAPKSYVAQWDRRRGRGILLIEDLAARGCRLDDVRAGCAPADASRVLATLAALHAHYWNSPRFHGDLRGLVNSSAHHAIAHQVKVAGLKRAIDIVPQDVQRAARLLVEHGDAVDAFWGSLASTLTHGDTHLGNAYFNPDGSAGFFDWQVASEGPAIRDVAYFLNSSLPPDVARAHERDLLDEYRRQLAQCGGPDLGSGELWDLYRATATHFYVGAVVTAAFGDRLQAGDIARVGVERAVAAVTSLDSFDVLRRFIN